MNPIDLCLINLNNTELSKGKEREKSDTNASASFVVDVVARFCQKGQWKWNNALELWKAKPEKKHRIPHIVS